MIPDFFRRFFTKLSLKKKILLVAALIFTGLGILASVLGVIAAAGVYLYLAPDLPSVEKLKEVRLQEPLRIYSRDNRLIAEYGEKRRAPLPISAIPEPVKQAFLASEDDRFNEHPGVDYQGLLRAAFNQLLTGDRSQGGSTITMQVARNFFLTREKTYLRKINEIFLALRIEKELSKDNILELYLNKIYLGRRAYGVAAAAQAYYGVDINELNLAQIAMIAGLPKAPSAFNPVANPERARLRRDYVLGRMLDLEMISEPEYEEAMNAPITAGAYEVPVDAEAPYLAEMVRAEMVERFGEEAYTSGLKVYTTLDSSLQAAANNALRNGLLDYEQRHGFRGPAKRVQMPDGMEHISIYIEQAETPVVESSPEPDSEFGPAAEFPPETAEQQADAAIAPESAESITQQLETEFELSEKEADTLLDETGRYGNIRPAVVLSFADREEPEPKADDAKQETEEEPVSLTYANLYIGEGEFAELDYTAIQWAKPRISVDQQGPEPKSIRDVLQIGDVVWVRSVEAGIWHLTQLPQVEGALASLDPQSGAILSLVGGFDFFKSKFNRAVQAKRQAGSSFKPFIYSAALDNGFTAASIINDAPVVFDDPALEGKWRPENYSGKFFGPTRLREGLVKSRNLVSIRLLIALGIGKARAYARQFGLPEESLPRDLSLVLGSGILTPLELASAFAVFANQGYRVEPFFMDRIENSDGKTIWLADYRVACLECFVETIDPVLLELDYIVEWPEPELPEGAEADVEGSEVADSTDQQPAAPEPDTPELSDESVEQQGTELAQASENDEQFQKEIPVPKRVVGQAEQVLSPQVSHIMNSMLRDVITRGTGVRARVLGRNDLAGKTGTTNDQHDAWFSGYNHQNVSTVWVGFDSHQPLGAKEAGSRAALPVWIDYMRLATADIKERPPAQPEEMVTIRIDAKTGLLATSDTDEAIFEIFRAENVPETTAADNTASVGPFVSPQAETAETGAEELF